MKITFAAAFCAAAFIISPVLSVAATHLGDTQVKPIVGTEVGLEHDPGNIVVAHSRTNKGGVLAFQNVKPGRYAVTIGSINWGDGTTRESGLTKSGAGVLILVSGQQPLSFTISRTPKQGKGPTTGDVDGSDNDRRFAFTINGNSQRTVTITLTHEIKSPRDPKSGR